MNLYDSLFHDVIFNDLEQQVQNLIGEDFKDISVVPVQQQSNDSDCGVFAMAQCNSTFLQSGQGYPKL